MRDYSPCDDTQLLSLVRQGDEGAYTEVYNRYWNKLLYKAGKKIQDTEEAKNIVQDIFFDIWRRRNTLNITGDLNHYLAVALKYQLIKYLNRERRKESLRDEITVPDAGADRTTEEYLAYSELNRRMAGLVAALPEKCRLVFRLREEGLSHQQIADEMGVSENTVHTHIKRALKSLRDGLAHIVFFLH